MFMGKPVGEMWSERKGAHQPTFISGNTHVIIGKHSKIKVPSFSAHTLHISGLIEKQKSELSVKIKIEKKLNSQQFTKFRDKAGIFGRHKRYIFS